MGFLDFLTGPETIETSSQYKPTDSEKRIYDSVYGQLNDVMNTQNQYYPGQGYVGASDPTQQGIQSLLGGATSIGGMVSPFQESWQRNLGASQDVANNPAVMAQMQANEQALNQNLQRNMLPGIQQGAIQGGGMNNARQGVAQGVAIGDTQNALANANAGTMMNAYNSGLQAEQAAMGQSGNLMNMVGMPSQMQLGAGQVGEGYDQRALQDAMNRYYFPSAENERRISYGTSIMGGMPQYGEQIGEQPNPGYTSLGNIAGQVLGGYLGGK